MHSTYSNNIDSIIDEERQYYKQLRRKRICYISCAIITVFTIAIIIRGAIVGGKDDKDMPQSSISNNDNSNGSNTDGSSDSISPKVNPNIDQTQLSETCTFLQMDDNLDECQLSNAFASPVVSGSTTIPSSIGILTNLKILIFKDQDLMGTIPDSIGLLTQLTYLHLGYNSFTSGSTIPTTIQKLSNLEYLFLYNNTYPLVLDSDDLCMSIPAGRNNAIYIDCDTTTTTSINGKCSCCKSERGEVC
jgi:hypothetical protein